MLHAFLLSFGVIFVAELGDKSQLMALAFATRYKTVPVLIAITLATGIVHLFSVALGGAIGTALPTKLISIIGAIAFVGFGIWTLRGDELTEEDKESTKVSSKLKHSKFTCALLQNSSNAEEVLATFATRKFGPM